MSSGRRSSGDLAGALGAYEAAPALMLALEGDEMVLASANEAARLALGERCEYGRPAREIAPEIDGSTRELLDEMVGTVLSTGRSITSPCHLVRVNEPEGEPSEVFWDLTMSPWFADDGSMRGVLAHGVDVTERTRSRLRADEQLHDVTAMQDALLPEWLPVLPGVEVSGRYLLASSEEEAGGDWYDVVGLPDGSVALIVGDVAGHGVAAAAGMGRLRAVLDERLGSGAGLDASMRALDSFARSSTDAEATTVCVVIVDPVSGRLEYCTAGHPPPLVVRPDDGLARFLPHTGASPLATTGVMTVGHDHVEQGDLVVLYTDGLLTRPGRGPSIGTVELGQVATSAAAPRRGAHRGPADRVCEQALAAMTHTTGYHDDIALLVAEVTEPAPPLHLDVAADDEAVPHVIDEIAVWLDSMRVRDLDHIVIQHAVDELVSNMVDHAYSAMAASGRVVVDAGLLGNGELELRFTDTGTWATPDDSSDRGRGLAIVRGMVDRLALEGTDGGTVATVRHRLSRPAHLLTGQVNGHGEPPSEATKRFTLSVDVDCMQLTGSIDHVAVGTLRHALREVAGRDRVVVDLEGVTRLPSSAVQALHHACRDAADRGHDLVLYAPPGTAAQHVLELVQLPYVMRPPVV